MPKTFYMEKNASKTVIVPSRSVTLYLDAVVVDTFRTNRLCLNG